VDEVDNVGIVDEEDVVVDSVEEVDVVDSVDVVDEDEVEDTVEDVDVADSVDVVGEVVVDNVDDSDVVSVVELISMFVRLLGPLAGLALTAGPLETTTVALNKRTNSASTIGVIVLKGRREL